MWGSAADQTRIWTVALTEYILYGGVMHIVNDEEETCPKYYTGNLRFHHVSGGLLFRLPAKTLTICRILSGMSWPYEWK